MHLASAYVRVESALNAHGVYPALNSVKYAAFIVVDGAHPFDAFVCKAFVFNKRPGHFILFRKIKGSVHEIGDQEMGGSVEEVLQIGKIVDGTL